jgi:protein PhnA
MAKISKELLSRAQESCELCKSTDMLIAHLVPPREEETLDSSILLCAKCSEQDIADENHWRCLLESMWSEAAPVQVMSYRLLRSLSHLGWAQEAVDTMYMDEDTTTWATELEVLAANKLTHLDSNGHVLTSGDSVVLIQDLDVKGSSLTARKGTIVRKIRLVYDNEEQIEGRVETQQIVILTKYVRKI